MRDKFRGQFERGICNNSLDAGRRPPLQEKVNPSRALWAAVVAEIGRINYVADLSQHMDDCTWTTSRLPDSPRELLHHEQRTHSDFGRFIEVVTAHREALCFILGVRSATHGLVPGPSQCDLLFCFRPEN